ncbi:decaprenyl-phosphate phosphoribosyltransferase [Kitasatospora aureofaciens]|uniref:decaprenyl-phosphate phosphoribosyltransferase n=1 Tax=Kitasatospora aureofaciens TaxID=1894 RepID=UPI0033C1F859|nr:decaprenyl-phosphate phosphoribosyltransferase [Streptomyces viridifaciens]
MSEATLESRTATAPDTAAAVAVPTAVETEPAVEAVAAVETEPAVEAVAAVETDTGVEAVAAVETEPAVEAGTASTVRPFRLKALPGGLLRNARPRQWVKNVLVLAAPGAAGMLTHTAVLRQVGIVFVLFCAAASSIYFLNDAIDVEADRAHPTKRHRPIASGVVPLPVAYVCAALLGGGAIAGALLLCNTPTAIALGCYLIMQFLYCTGLKHVLVVDLAFVTSGFLIRAMIGGLAADIRLSQWFLITTGFAALFMVAAKRYSELVSMGDKAASSRKLLGEYSNTYLRFVWQASAAVTVLSYCLWSSDHTTNADTALRQITVLPFIFAILRYAIFADRGTAEAPENVVLKDRPLLMLGAIWAGLYGFSVLGAV